MGTAVFGQVGETEFDLRFTLLGVPVRIHPIFWISSLYLAWEADRFDLTLVKLVCILVAVLVHELGHALMNARFGFRSEIVLYILGGYATSTRHSTWRDIAVSAAGPMAGFLLLAAVYLPFLWIGFIAEWSIFPIIIDPSAIAGWGPTFAIGEPGYELLTEAVVFSVFFNLVINLLNLVPVLPLDGGQISRELFLHYRRRDGMRLCLQTSMVTGAAIAAYGLFQRSREASVFGLDPLFLGIMFAYLAYQSYQALENYNRGGWR